MKVHVRADNMEQVTRWVNYIKANYPAGDVKVKPDENGTYNIYYRTPKNA